jgi:hypothetical protein
VKTEFSIRTLPFPCIPYIREVPGPIDRIKQSSMIKDSLITNKTLPPIVPNETQIEQLSKYPDLTLAERMG